jgi:1,4-dihydroxy-2-naphthoate octaprenyltransferase
MSSVRIWIMAARVRTQPAAEAPVLVGTELSWSERYLRVGGLIAAIVGVLLLLFC